MKNALNFLQMPSCNSRYLILLDASNDRPMDFEMIEFNDLAASKVAAPRAGISGYEEEYLPISRLVKDRIGNVLCKKKHLGTNDRSSQ